MFKMTRLIRCFVLLVSASLTFGCAFNLRDVQYQPARLESTGGDAVPFKLTADTPIHGAPCGYSRTLRKDTRWEPTGRIVEGIVYRSKDQILTLECSNVFEAYLVVEAQRLVGFYLPVEKSFSTLDEPIPLVISQKP